MSAERFFDDLARTLAEPMPRRRALRLAAGALVSAAVPGAFARGTLAAPRSVLTTGEIICPPNTNRCACPSTIGGLEAVTCCPTHPYYRWTCKCPGGKAQCLKSETCPEERQHCGPCCPDGQVCNTLLGECIPNCNPNADLTPCGTSCCDGSEYCCDRVFTRKAPYCCTSEEAEKEPWKDGEVASMIALVALGALAVATGGLVAIAIGGLAVGFGLGGVGFKIAGDDPPDPRYKELFRPRVPRVASVRPGDGVTPAAARALDHLIANRLRAGAYILAWIRSIEKAQGADKARDKSWAQRHRKAAAGYAREAATTLARDKSLSTVARRELERGGFVDTGVTLGQARQWQQLVRQRGLPAEMTRVLRAAGVDDVRIAGFRTAVSRLDTKLVAGVGVFGSLTDQRLAAANTATIKALRRAARA